MKYFDYLLIAVLFISFLFMFNFTEAKTISKGNAYGQDVNVADMNGWIDIKYMLKSKDANINYAITYSLSGIDYNYIFSSIPGNIKAWAGMTGKFTDLNNYSTYSKWGHKFTEPSTGHLKSFIYEIKTDDIITIKGLKISFSNTIMDFSDIDSNGFSVSILKFSDTNIQVIVSIPDSNSEIDLDPFISASFTSTSTKEPRSKVARSLTDGNIAVVWDEGTKTIFSLSQDGNVWSDLNLIGALNPSIDVNSTGGWVVAVGSNDVNIRTCSKDCNASTSNWLVSNNFTNTSTAGNPSVIVDTDNNIHIAWYDGRQIKYSQCTNTGQFCSTAVVISISINAEVRNPFIDINSSGGKAITWSDNTPYGNLHFAECSKDCNASASNWIDLNMTDVNGANTQYSTVIGSPDGNWNLIYSKQEKDSLGLSTNDIMHRMCLNNCSVIGNWKDWNVSATADESIYPSFVIDNNKVIHVVWSDKNNASTYRIFYKRRNSATGWDSNYMLLSSPSSVNPNYINVRRKIGGLNGLNIIDYIDVNSAGVFFDTNNLGTANAPATTEINSIIRDNTKTNGALQYGRKIVRDSITDKLFVVWEEDFNVLFAQSDDNGLNWSSPLVLNIAAGQPNTMTGNPRDPVIDINSTGGIWVAYFWGFSGPSGNRQIVLKTCSRTTTVDCNTTYSNWSADANVSRKETDQTNHEYPIIKISSDNNAHVAWVNQAGNLTYTMISKGLDWNFDGSEGLTKFTATSSGQYDIDVNSTSGIKLIWSIGGAGSDLNYAECSKDCNGNLSNWQTLNISNNSGASAFPQITISNDDKSHVVWHDDNSMADTQIFYKNCSNNCGVIGNWSANDLNISAGNSGKTAREPTITHDYDNNVYVLWYDNNSRSDGNYQVFYRKRTSGGTWDNNATMKYDTNNIFGRGVQAPRDTNAKSNLQKLSFVYVREPIYTVGFNTRLLGTFTAVSTPSNNPIDANTVKIDGNPDNVALPSFTYGTDGNLTIDFNVFDLDYNGSFWGIGRFDANIEARDTNGTPFRIITDLNLMVSGRCNDLNFAGIKDNNKYGTTCHWDWNIALITDRNIFIDINVTDNNGSTDTNSSDYNFRVNPTISAPSNNPIDSNTIKIDGNSDNQPLNYYSYFRDGNLTIDFNVFDLDYNGSFWGVGRLDANIAFRDMNGLTTRIITDLNLTRSKSIGSNAGLYCDDLNFAGIKDNNKYGTTCHFDWNIVYVTDRNVFIDINVTDNNGSTDTNSSDFNFGIDNTKPTTTSVDFNYLWQKNNVLVRLTCSDNNSGCDTTRYRIDTNDLNDDSMGSWITYSSAFSVKNDGNWRVDFNSVDRAGNIEDTNTQYVFSDSNLPYATSAIPTSDENATSINISLSIDDDLSKLDYCDFNVYKNDIFYKENQREVLTPVDKSCGIVDTNEVGGDTIKVDFAVYDLAGNRFDYNSFIITFSSGASVSAGSTGGGGGAGEGAIITTTQPLTQVYTEAQLSTISTIVNSFAAVNKIYTQSEFDALLANLQIQNQIPINSTDLTNFLNSVGSSQLVSREVAIEKTIEGGGGEEKVVISDNQVVLTPKLVEDLVSTKVLYVVPGEKKLYTITLSNKTRKEIPLTVTIDKQLQPYVKLVSDVKVVGVEKATKLEFEVYSSTKIEKKIEGYIELNLNNKQELIYEKLTLSGQEENIFVSLANMPIIPLSQEIPGIGKTITLGWLAIFSFAGGIITKLIGLW